MVLYLTLMNLKQIQSLNSYRDVKMISPHTQMSFRVHRTDSWGRRNQAVVKTKNHIAINTVGDDSILLTVLHDYKVTKKTIALKTESMITTVFQPQKLKIDWRA